VPKGGAAGHGQTLGNRLFAGDFVWRDPDSFGGLDVLVSTAVAVALGRFLEVDADDFDGTVAITFTGAVNVIRAALPELRATGGVIVATSSIMASLPLPAFSSYAAAKHALRGFLNTLQIEEREQGTGVRVTMVSPGPVDTPVYKHATSATGRRPAIPPDSSHPETVAGALVEVALAPRNERIVGGESKLVDLLYRHARPAAELVLLFVDRWFRTGTVPAEAPGALWQPSEQARVSGGIPARSSET
jgi:NAD(P)-dependent dehydrogenase (short-subunit alcohol dehydrogenase family)